MRWRDTLYYAHTPGNFPKLHTNTMICIMYIYLIPFYWKFRSKAMCLYVCVHCASHAISFFAPFHYSNKWIKIHAFSMFDLKPILASTANTATPTIQSCVTFEAFYCVCICLFAHSFILFVWLPSIPVIFLPIPSFLLNVSFCASRATNEFVIWCFVFKL